MKCLKPAAHSGRVQIAACRAPARGGVMVAEKPLIFVADDDELLLQLVSHKLQQRGFRCRCVSNGEELLAAVVETSPHVIVLDAMMPVVDGFETLRRLRDGQSTSSIPVLMLTARRGEADVVRALELGASDFVAKPFLPEELVLRVKQLLVRAKAA